MASGKPGWTIAVLDPVGFALLCHVDFTPSIELGCLCLGRVDPYLESGPPPTYNFVPTAILTKVLPGPHVAEVEAVVAMVFEQAHCHVPDDDCTDQPSANTVAGLVR